MDGRNLDLGNGEAMVIGTAADLRTAADYLDEHYPDGGDGPRLGPVTGPILNMGIRLITEVMDWAPDTLTQREHKTLMIFAEDAIDGEPGELDDHGREKRVIRQRTDSPQMLLRTRISRTGLYEILRALVAKGCLEQVAAGGRNHPARYRIPSLPPVVQCPDFQDTETGSVSGNT